jgi:hypothetical protein
MTGGRTRRELMGSAMLAAASGCALSGAVAADAAAVPITDANLLQRALGVEHLVVIAYRRVLSSGTLTPGLAGKVHSILGQELQHVAMLEHALGRLGASPSPPPQDLPAAQRALSSHHVGASLMDLHTQNQCLKLLVDVETVAEDAYFVAIGKLRDAGLLRMSAQIMGCEAQHWTVLSAVRHHGDVMISVPYPFVGGTS